MPNQADSGNEKNELHAEQTSLQAQASAPGSQVKGGLDYSVDFIWGSDQDQYVNPEE